MVKAPFSLQQIKSNLHQIYDDADSTHAHRILSQARKRKDTKRTRVLLPDGSHDAVNINALMSRALNVQFHSTR